MHVSQNSPSTQQPTDFQIASRNELEGVKQIWLSQTPKVLTSQIYFFVPSKSSLLHPVSIQNSGPTRHISPVLRQTTVGVPLYDMSLFSSCRGMELVVNRGTTSTVVTAYDHRSLYTLFNKDLVHFGEWHLKGY